jgi:hypothetical protein
MLEKGLELAGWDSRRRIGQFDAGRSAAATIDALATVA